jgi:hypothetical protein
MEMGEYRCSQTNRAIVSDGHGFRIEFVKIYTLADPALFPDVDAAQPVERRAQ